MSRSTLILVLASLVALPVSLAAAKANTATEIAISPNPVGQYCSATATATTKTPDLNGAAVTSGTTQVHAGHFNCPFPPGLGRNLASGDVDSNGQFSTEVTANTGDYLNTGAGNTSWLGSFAYRAKYLAQGPDFKDSDSPCLPLQVVSQGACVTSCPASGLTILATKAGGPGCPAPGSGTWTYRITVTNCSGVPISSVTAQGGSNGWTTNNPLMSADTGSVGIRKTNLKNSTILWNIGPMGPGQIANLDVMLSGTIKNGTPDGTVLYLNGPWSAINGDLLPPGNKTEYTDRVTLTVQSSGTCPSL